MKRDKGHNLMSYVIIGLLVLIIVLQIIFLNNAEFGPRKNFDVNEEFLHDANTIPEAEEVLNNALIEGVINTEDYQNGLNLLEKLPQFISKENANLYLKWGFKCNGCAGGDCCLYIYF